MLGSSAMCVELLSNYTDALSSTSIISKYPYEAFACMYNLFRMLQ